MLTAYRKIYVLIVLLICFSSLLLAEGKPSAAQNSPAEKAAPADKVLPAEAAPPVDKAPVVEAAPPAEVASSDIFISGEEGYHTFRIPSVVATGTGTILAFCEGRKKGRSDSGDIDIVLKRSADAGATWSDLQVVYDDKDNTCGNPCTVVDEDTGTIFLLSTWNHGSDNEAKISSGKSKDLRRVFVQSSRDDGLTWSDPDEITTSVKLPGWTWYATGPGTGIQLRIGKNKGRLMIPCDHKVTNEKLEYHSHVIYSDDHGSSWQLGGGVENGTNECHVIERADGTLLLNIRRAREVKEPYRMTATSADGGMTWSNYSLDRQLTDPRCQSSFIRYTFSNAATKPIVLHCNPANESERKQMTIRASDDDAKSWMYSKVLDEGNCAYSSMAVTPDGKIAVIFEAGKSGPYEKITFRCFSMDWLTGKKEASIPPASAATRYSLANTDLIDKAVDAVFFEAAEETEEAPGHLSGFEPNSVENAAVITTNPFEVDGDSLCVSVDILESGSLKVVIADEGGNTLSSSMAIKESLEAGKVAWLDGWDLASIKGKKVRLKFVFEKAKLYEFQIK